MYLQNRELFGLFSVCAFPNDSNIGFESEICCPMSATESENSHRDSKMYFADSVLPAPLKPDIIIDWFRFIVLIESYARFAEIVNVQVNIKWIKIMHKANEFP